MKAFKVISETAAVAKGQRWNNRGYKLVADVWSQDEFYDLVQSLEDKDFFPENDGFVFDGNQNEVYDPNYPESGFDFGDYQYVCIEEKDLSDYMIAALED